MTVDGDLISSIGKGLLIFAGVGKDDTVKDAESMASKVLKMKLFEDDSGGKVSSTLLPTEFFALTQAKVETKRSRRARRDSLRYVSRY